MKKYDKYKSSFIPWITAIPDHWDEYRAKRLFVTKKDKNTGNQEANVLSLTLKGVIRNNGDKPIGLSPDDYSTYQIFEKNDLVFKLIDLENISTSRVGIVPERGIMSSAYIRFIARADMNIRYFFMQYYSMWQRNIFNGLGAGVRQTLSSDDLLNISIAVPSRDEQDQIVRFLDWKVSEINKLISVRKQQIVKLEELKRSEIGHLVMGQSKSVPQRETAIGWVKTIPSNWCEKSLIQLAEEQQIKNIGMIENNLLSLSYGKIINKDINTTDGLLPASFEGYQIVHDGNIVLRLTDLQNDHKSLRTGLVTQTGIITSAYTCLKAREGIIPEYLQLQLHVADLCKVFYSMGGGVRQSIGFKDIRYMLIAVPSVDEQLRILALAHKIEEPIDRAVKNLKGIISILEEYKTKLIADVVTGKVDVRGIEIPEYEFVEEVGIDKTDEDSDNIDEQED